MSGPEKGFFCVARGWRDDPALAREPNEPFSRAEAWLWMLEAAAWADTTQDCAGKRVHVRRGQFSTSYRILSQAWLWPIANVQRFIARRKSDTAIDTATDTGRMLITICNYDKYQFSARNGDTPSDTPSDTQKEKPLSNTGEERGAVVRFPGPPSPSPPPPPPPPPAEEKAEAERRGHYRVAAYELVEAFDAARDKAFPGRARMFPNARDHHYADQWLAAAEEHAIDAAAVVEMARGTFREGFGKRARERDDPPDVLKFFDRAMLRLIAQRAGPAPRVVPAEPREAPPPRLNGRAPRTTAATMLRAAHTAAALVEE